MQHLVSVATQAISTCALIVDKKIKENQKRYDENCLSLKAGLTGGFSSVGGLA